MGPLRGVTVVQLASLAPAPFACMVLADLGATVVRVDRVTDVLTSTPGVHVTDVMGRGQQSIGIDLKDPAGVETVLRLLESADVLVEGFRPGVTERLGIGPDPCLARNPRLVYARMTGWGQDGPLAQAAAHDINYLALSGALYPLGRATTTPTAPLNLLGDFGGGGMLLALGIVSALFERTQSGLGQVVDAAMLDGAALLSSQLHGALASGDYREIRGSNILDAGAHFYNTYETSDGEFISVGAVEPRFLGQLLKLLDLPDHDLDMHYEWERWPGLVEQFAAVFKTKTRAEWCQLLERTDACFAPVLRPVKPPPTRTTRPGRPSSLWRASGNPPRRRGSAERRRNTPGRHR